MVDGVSGIKHPQIHTVSVRRDSLAIRVRVSHSSRFQNELN